MAVYSHSRLSTFEQCPRKFKFRYIEKIKPEIEKTIEAYLGEIVDEVLEWIYNKVKNGKTPNLDEIIKQYAEQWQRNLTKNIQITKRNLNDKDYFNKGTQFLIDYYMKHFPFDDGTIECEKEIILELDEHGKYKIQGFIDRLVYNMKTGEYEIHDYKTGNTLPDQQKIDEDRQLALYSIAIKQIYGQDKEILLVWHYLAHNKKIESKRSNAQLEKLKQDTIELIQKIESATEFPTKRSILCDWCEYKSTCFNSEIQRGFPTIGKYLKRE